MMTFDLTFITAAFCRGAYSTPEIRPPSIRGQIHWWFRALGGLYHDEKTIFGGVNQGAEASKVVVRVSNIKGTTAELRTLPHKQGGEASPKDAWSPGTTFKLHVAYRLGGLGSKHRESFERALEAWLLLGTLGLRSTRAAGCFAWTGAAAAPYQPPHQFEDFDARCQKLLAGSRLRYALLGQEYNSPETARRDVSDTLGGRNDRPGQNDLERLNDPLGKIRPGRKTSPLRFRIVEFERVSRVAALWDGRENVTGNRPSDLAGIIRLLAQREKPMGRQLERSALNG